MIDKKTVFEIHKLKNENYSNRKIAHFLKISRETVSKYLKNPEVAISGKVNRKSKLEPYYEQIDQYLEEDNQVNGEVIFQKLCQQGYDGKISNLRAYLRKVRGKHKNSQAYIRFESEPGEDFQIDWGHFPALTYGTTKRKLYCLAVTECYSRMIYVAFTHSQKQEVLHQALLDAFIFFGGTPKKIVVDNMLTAVQERVGKIISYNGEFLEFLRPFNITPYACNVRSPHEKGKVENVIGYIKKNFWPLRSFKCIEDVNRQKKTWCETTANIRIHGTTGEQPVERFKKVKLRSLPKFLPDCREIVDCKVYKDFCIKFDGNTYTTPPWTLGKQVKLKASQNQVMIYLKEKVIATHFRSWKRNERIELPSHVEQVKRLEKKLWSDKDIAIFASLGPEASEYIKLLGKARQPIKKSVLKMLRLKDEYGKSAVIDAIKKALKHKAYGADYIENIIYQEMTPEKQYLPVNLKDEEMNQIRLEEPCLEAYDRYIIQRSKNG
ncbi:Integrase, catalytic core domain protein [Candidatus Magnetomorum sp. HK-1]|nr:Integrase, catalytic core domain protein [Candidatus Magnetomorum sp. HK-1]